MTIEQLVQAIDDKEDALSVLAQRVVDALRDIGVEDAAPDYIAVGQTWARVYTDYGDTRLYDRPFIEFDCEGIRRGSQYASAEEFLDALRGVLAYRLQEAEGAHDQLKALLERLEATHEVAGN